jgi:hypothetical protein
MTTSQCGELVVCLDTEFTGLSSECALISIGMASEDGKSFYAEVRGTDTVTECSEFVRNQILPLLGDGPQRTWSELCLSLSTWLKAFNQPLRIATDSLRWDWCWIERLFSAPGAWPDNLAHEPFLLTMNYLDDYERFEAGVEAAFSSGLRRHHALDDAKAHLAGYCASQYSSTHYGLSSDRDE